MWYTMEEKVSIHVASMMHMYSSLWPDDNLVLVVPKEMYVVSDIKIVSRKFK